MNWFEDAFCRVDDRAVAALGVSSFGLNTVILVLSAALALSALVAWKDIFGVLRRAGFSRAVQFLVFAFLFVYPLIQMCISFLRSFGWQAVACPGPELTSIIAMVTYFLFVWGIHIEKQNKGSLQKFLTLIVLPVAGLYVATAKAALGIALKLLGYP
jgi:hypothetical protein